MKHYLSKLPVILITTGCLHLISFSSHAQQKKKEIIQKQSPAYAISRGNSGAVIEIKNEKPVCKLVFLNEPFCQRQNGSFNMNCGTMFISGQTF